MAEKTDRRIRKTRAQLRKGLAELMQENPDAFVTADEIGCGIVPMEAFERDYRETDGRICQRIAAYSEEVHRVICGLGMRIK